MSPRPRNAIPEEEAPPASMGRILPEVAPLPLGMDEPEKLEPLDMWAADNRAYGLLEEQFDEIQSFIERLVTWYSLPETVVPPCWALHTSLLLELVSLREFRAHWYQGALSAPDAGAHWHRELDMALTRLRRWTSETGCNVREHREQRQPAWLESEGVIPLHYQGVIAAAKQQITERVHDEKVSDLYERASESE